MKTTVVETLNQYDGEPLLHIRQDESGQKYYCHCLDMLKEHTVYLMIPVSDADIEAVKSNSVSLRSILDREERYTLKWGEEEVIERCTEPVPEDCLPAPDVKFNPP